MTCPRLMSKEDMIFGLQRGKTLCVDRKDAPELADLMEMEKEGWVTSELVVIDEQSSVLKFRWKK